LCVISPSFSAMKPVFWMFTFGIFCVVMS
jgi:hypothetical protein